MTVVPNDSRPCHVVAALESTIRPDQRCGVRWLVVDNATAALRSAVLNSFPRLQGIPLDTSSTSLWHRIGSLLARRCSADSSASSTWSCPWIHRLISTFPSTVISRLRCMTRSSTFTNTYVNIHSIARNWTWPSPT